MVSNQNQKLKDGYVELIHAQQPTLFITLATNQAYDISKMRGLVCNYLARVDHAFLGSKWSKKPALERMNGLFFVEHVCTNTHAHGLIKAPYSNRIGLQLQSNEIWEKLCPSGSITIKPITDLARLGNYVMKEAYKDTFFDKQLFFANEFMSG